VSRISVSSRQHANRIDDSCVTRSSAKRVKMPPSLVQITRVAEFCLLARGLRYSRVVRCGGVPRPALERETKNGAGHARRIKKTPAFAECSQTWLVRPPPFVSFRQTLDEHLTPSRTPTPASLASWRLIPLRRKPTPTGRCRAPGAPGAGHRRGVLRSGAPHNRKSYAVLGSGCDLC